MLDFSRLGHHNICWVLWSQQCSYLLSRIFSKLTSCVAEKFLLHPQEICQQAHFIHGGQPERFLNCSLYPPDRQREAYTPLLPLNCNLAAQSKPAPSGDSDGDVPLDSQQPGCPTWRWAAGAVWQCLHSPAHLTLSLLGTDVSLQVSCHKVHEKIWIYAKGEVNTESKGREKVA